MGTNYYRIPSLQEMAQRKTKLIEDVTNLELTPSMVESNFADVERVLMKKLNIKKYSIPKIPLPLGLLGLLLRTLGRNSTNPRCNYSSEKLKKLGFVPQVPFEAALDEYAEWYLTSLV